MEDQKTARVHIALKPAEIEAIDNWRYANHVPARSEAIRALIRLGLEASPS